jgi:16S rRNA (guanine966-N2)-methyltransferase
VRIVAGSAKGVRLAPVPPGTRPVSDRAREGMFSSLGEAVVGARVLDLFAGTGALGIEALSRGAASAELVERAQPAIRAIRDNLARTRLAGRAAIRSVSASRSLRAGREPFDLVLADPPYDLADADLFALLDRIARLGLLAPDARVVITRRARSYSGVIPIHFALDKRLEYGDTLVLVIREDARARKRSVPGDL